jgi:hypothetical protein
MHLKVNDLVILHAMSGATDSLTCPIFGGKFGGVYGRVVKLQTGDHDPTKHTVEVHWSNGHRWQFKEHQLRSVDPLHPPTMTAVIPPPAGQDMLVPPQEGLYIFLRPSSSFSGLRVGMISEDFQPGKVNSTDAWVSIATHTPVPEDICEEQLLSRISSLRPVMGTHDTCLDAVNTVLHYNGFAPLVQCEIEKVPLFTTFQAAKRSEGTCRDRGFLLFTLPKSA